MIIPSIVSELSQVIVKKFENLELPFNCCEKNLVFKFKNPIDNFMGAICPETFWFIVLEVNNL